jgi:hypothetical protein
MLAVVSLLIAAIVWRQTRLDSKSRIESETVV